MRYSFAAILTVMALLSQGCAPSPSQEIGTISSKDIVPGKSTRGGEATAPAAAEPAARESGEGPPADR